MDDAQDAPACVTVNVWPATVNVPVRALLLVFAAALNPTDPLLVPLMPFMIVSQAALLLAVQLHPVPVVTVTDPVPPDAPIDWLPGAMEAVQDAPACVTVNV